MEEPTDSTAQSLNVKFLWEGLHMAGYSQLNRMLMVDTVLSDHKLFPEEQNFEGDPLLLVSIDAVEGISKLFTYQLVMLRDAGGFDPITEKRPPIDPTTLIGTHAVIGIRADTDQNFTFRAGMFETFEDVLGIDITHLGPVHFRDFHIYKARVVPWVKALSRDICYRVFERRTVVDVIEVIANEASQQFPYLVINTAGLKQDPKLTEIIDYIVQFGESTLDFLNRLMARFGIWYYFGHSTKTGVINQIMVLRSYQTHVKLMVGEPDVTITDNDPNSDNIAKLVRRYRPPQRRVSINGLNELVPSRPFTREMAVAASEDQLKAEGGSAIDTKWFGTTSFGEALRSDSDADASIKVTASQNQERVVIISGVSKNATFVPGYCFHVVKPDDFDPTDNLNMPFIDIVDKDFIIDSHTISCHDFSYINLAGWEALDIFFNTFSTLDTDNTSISNQALAKVSMWVSNNAQNQVFPIGSANKGDPNSPGQLWQPTVYKNDQGIYNVSVFHAALNSLFWLAIQGIDIPKMLKDKANETVFGNGFIAIPHSEPLDVPLPDAVQPKAQGPHTAVVIGHNGANPNGEDVYCDALGRVRVRFPWDPGPSSSPGELPPRFPASQSDKPTKVGDNTCWVRVVEGWAGRQYGTQFLPRVGQEVLVDFLNGDPERPIIVGRLYNADKGDTNLTFPDSQDRGRQIDRLTQLPETAKSNLPLSGIKTRSIPTSQRDGSPLPERFNLLRFSDKRGHEQYLIRSQGRLDITSYFSRYETIHLDRHLTVGGKLDDSTPPMQGDYIAKIYGDYHLHIGDTELPPDVGNRYTLIEQNDEIRVVKNSDQSIGGTWSTSAGQATLAALGRGGTIVLTASTNITLSVGGSSVVITPAGVAITAPTINFVSPATRSTLPVVRGPTPLAPAPPVLPSVRKPKDPTLADPGNNLTPPE